MGLLVYIPLLAGLALPPTSRVLRRWVRPRVALWVLTIAALVLAVASAVSVALLMWPLLARIPEVAAEGRWRPQDVAHADPVPFPVSLAATVAGIVVVVRSVLAARRNRADASARRELHRALTLLDRDAGVVLVSDAAVGAYAVPAVRGHRARVVVTSSMRAVLDDAELDAVVAHEWAHVHQHHRRFAVAADLAAAVHPLMGTVRSDIDVLIERCADEGAAVGTGRTVTLRALARAALAATGAPVAPATGVLHHALHAVAERVAALAEPPVRRRWPIVVVLALVAAATVAAARSVIDTEQIFDTLLRTRALLTH